MERTKRRQSKASLDDRFQFMGDAVAAGDRAALRSAIFEVEDRASGGEFLLKLWRKSNAPVDDHLRQLWLHEMRQVQRIMAYAGASDVIVDVLEFVEDNEHFGVLLEKAGHPLSERIRRVFSQHWLRNLGATRARVLFWRNIKRVVAALGIIHAQGLVHGRLTADVIMTEGSDEPDFQVGGFEWSLRVSGDAVSQVPASIMPQKSAETAQHYSFAEDWRALGFLAANCLDVEVLPSGNVAPRAGAPSSIVLQPPEQIFLKRLVAPGRMDQLDADSLGRALDDVITNIGIVAAAHSGSFILMFDLQSKLGDAVYRASEGAIATDEFRKQLDWVRADLDGGATLLVPREFDPANGRLKLVTDSMTYRLRPSRGEGSAAVWDIAICQEVESRAASFSVGDTVEHAIDQEILIATGIRNAQDTRARLGPDVLDWSAFAASPQGRSPGTGDTNAVKRALLLIQIIEAVAKALEVYPVEVLDTGRQDGRRYVVLRAEPNNDRDRLAKRIGMVESASALIRLFEEEHQEAEAKWRLSQAASLGATRAADVVASFIDLVDHRGRRGYRFEIDEELPGERPLFLRTERDAGTEQVIARRLRNIKAIDTRVDLAAMLVDPWQIRRSSRETLNDDDRRDAAFVDLDKPKQEALVGLWSTLPSFFVVGPPGVGKTKLATEVVRRRFKGDPSTRMLVSAQGHDALDNLQTKIKETLAKAGMKDVLLVRSTTPEERPTSDEEIHRAGADFIGRLANSALAKDAPPQIKSRIVALNDAAERLNVARDGVDRELRAGLGAISHLVLDAANIVMSTANSSDVERLVEAREQFDWVIIEEAAKALGPELLGPLMLSGRRLMIGDHHQLPPQEAERLAKILGDHSLVSEALALAEQMIGPLLKDDELDDLDFDEARSLVHTCDMALRLLEPFRTFVEEDERRNRVQAGHRPIAATLTEQRRMDPAIAEVVSKAFYKGTLRTEGRRARAAVEEAPPFVHLGAVPVSPIVVVDFPHVSSTGRSDALERSRPRWHNPSEVAAVIDVLRQVRAREGSEQPSLAILTPYKVQAKKLHERLNALRRQELKHLDDFKAIRSNGDFIGTVDSFQGGEADLVILSLVRNNAMAGGRALGFLRDPRRMNVALSRAKSQLILVGSLDFLRETVRGVNPDNETHDLSFLTEVVAAITALRDTSRNGLPLASFLKPDALRQRI